MFPEKEFDHSACEECSDVLAGLEQRGGIPHGVEVFVQHEPIDLRRGSIGSRGCSPIG